MVLSGASKDGNQFQVLTIEERFFFIEIRSSVPENEHEAQEQRFRWKMIFRIAKMSSVENPVWLFDIGDYTAQLYGDYDKPI